MNLKPKQKFLYLFDYGDEWHFEVDFLKEGSSEKARYPRITDSRGEAPQQSEDSDEEENRKPRIRRPKIRNTHSDFEPGMRAHLC